MKTNRRQRSRNFTKAPKSSAARQNSCQQPFKEQLQSTPINYDQFRATTSSHEKLRSTTARNYPKLSQRIAINYGSYGIIAATVNHESQSQNRQHLFQIQGIETRSEPCPHRTQNTARHQVSTHNTSPPKPIPQRRHLDNHVQLLPKPRHIWQGKGKVVGNSRLKARSSTERHRHLKR